MLTAVIVSTRPPGSTDQTTAPAAATAPVAPDLTTGHLHQVDLVRLLTFSAVIAVHSIAFTEPASSRAAGADLMVLQFGRAVFFALTAFVLVHSARPGGERVTAFWRRRFLYVAVPYVGWSAVYYAVTPGRGPFSVATLASDLVSGAAAYHLYFLLVTMQLYLVFPWLLRFLRATAGRAWAVLAVAAVANAAWYAAVTYVTPPAGWAGFAWLHAYVLLPSYTLYVLAGGYAAVRLADVQAAVRLWGRALLVASVAAVVVAEGVYAVQLRAWDPRRAAGVLQPAMILTSLAAMVVLYVAGSRWAAGRRAGAGLVKEASDISFGVYLAHPLVLQYLLDQGLGGSHSGLPAWAATVLAGAGCTAGAAVLTLVARRTPLSLALTGRGQRGRPPAPALRPRLAIEGTAR